MRVSGAKLRCVASALVLLLTACSSAPGSGSAPPPRDDTATSGASGACESAVKGGGVAFEPCAAAARAGDVDAMVELGRAYHLAARAGKGDFGAAYGWYLMALTEGNATALNNIAVMFREGEGVPKDPAVAHALFLVIYLLELGGTDTQMTVGANLNRSSHTQPQAELNRAFCFTEAYLLQVVRDRGASLTTSLATLGPDGFLRVALRDADWWSRDERAQLVTGIPDCGVALGVPVAIAPEETAFVDAIIQKDRKAAREIVERATAAGDAAAGIQLAVLLLDRGATPADQTRSYALLRDAYFAGGVDAGTLGNLQAFFSAGWGGVEKDKKLAYAMTRLASLRAPPSFHHHFSGRSLLRRYDRDLPAADREEALCYSVEYLEAAIRLGHRDAAQAPVARAATTRVPLRDLPSVWPGEQSRVQRATPACAQVW